MEENLDDKDKEDDDGKDEEDREVPVLEPMVQVLITVGGGIKNKNYNQ